MSLFTKMVHYPDSSIDGAKARLVFIDNIRVFLTILVIAHHAAHAYVPTVNSQWPFFDRDRTEILSAFLSVNSAFFMGMFFLISGYFLPGSYDRKGAIAFLKDRFLRLGTPIFLFAWLVFPTLIYIMSNPEIAFAQFLIQTYSNLDRIELAHLWFIAHLLLYAVGYVVWRQLQDCNYANRVVKSVSPPKDRQILLYLMFLAIVTFLVRIQYPIDTWPRLFHFIPVEVAHLPQYLSLFMIGVFSYRHHWFLRIPVKQGRRWLAIGAIAALLDYFYVSVRGSLLSGQIIARGGWNWQSFLWSIWEATICVGLCLGLLVFFRESLNDAGRWGKILSANAYWVYLIHFPIVIALQLCIAAISIPAFIKFIVVTILSIPLCFGISHGLRNRFFQRIKLQKKYSSN